MRQRMYSTQYLGHRTSQEYAGPFIIIAIVALSLSSLSSSSKEEKIISKKKNRMAQIIFTEKFIGMPPVNQKLSSLGHMVSNDTGALDRISKKVK